MRLWVGPPSGLEDVVCLPIKLSYNTGLSVASNFCCGKTELRELQTPPTSTVPFLGFNLVETTSAQPQRGRGQTQQKPNSAKLLLWKLNVKNPSTVEVTRSQHAGNWGSKNKLDRKLTQLSLRFQKTSGWGRKYSLLCPKVHMTNKILIPLQFLISCFLESPPNM